MINKQTLVLNTDGTPISIIQWYKAIGLIYVKRVAIQIDFYSGTKIKDSMGIYYSIPAVILLTKYVHRPVKSPPFNRKNVFIRDNYQCQYCGNVYDSLDLTLDHVVPRNKWKSEKTPTTWLNIVTACYKCNSKKADKTLEKSGMKILRQPYIPKAYGIQYLLKHKYDNVPKEWIKYTK